MAHRNEKQTTLLSEVGDSACQPCVSAIKATQHQMIGDSPPFNPKSECDYGSETECTSDQYCYWDRGRCVIGV